MKKKELNKGKIIQMSPKTTTKRSSEWTINRESKVISMDSAKSQLHKKFVDNILQNGKSF